MSFFSSLKRGLGLGGDDSVAEDSLYADTTERESAPAAAGGSGQTDATPAPAIDPDARDRIFERVVAVFDAALPDFLQRSVDPAAQRRYLLDALDADMRAYLDRLAEAAQSHCRSEWEERQASLAAELDAVRTRSAELERQGAEMKQRQLSADRQKRALADRVHDLEATLGKLEAESEQYQLENRSLVNRLKVAAVQTGDNDAARGEIERLTAENARLGEQLAALEAREPETGTAEREALAKQIEEMTEGISSLKEQQRVSDEMLADQRERLAAATAELEARNADVQAREADLAARAAELAEARTKLAEVEAALADFNEIAGKMEELDRALTARDEKIKRQKKLLASRDAEIESLRHTVGENIRLQAEREKELMEQIETLRRPQAAAETPASYGAQTADRNAADSPESPAPRISEDDLSEIERTFESEEWFTKTPPPETPSMRPADADADFGYHPPKRRTPPAANPNQLSLF